MTSDKDEERSTAMVFLFTKENGIMDCEMVKAQPIMNGEYYGTPEVGKRESSMEKVNFMNMVSALKGNGKPAD